MGVRYHPTQRPRYIAIADAVVTGKVRRSTFVRDSLVTFAPLSARRPFRDALPCIASNADLNTLVGYPNDVDLKHTHQQGLASFAKAHSVPMISTA